MNILVLSLLRAGDILLQRPLLESIKSVHPAAKLHLMINDECRWVAPLLSADKLHFFPRADLQKLMGEANHGIMRAPVELDRFLESINKNNFTKIFNLTHTRLSAYLAEEISAKEKKGLSNDGLKVNGINNPWIKLFNDRFSARTEFSFHYVDILARSFGLKVRAPGILPSGSIDRILIQPLTSDKKKNWSLLNFRNLVNEIYAGFPEIPVRVLCSQNDKERLINYFEEEELCDWNLPQIDQQLNASDLLISGDTAVMHLAAGKSVRTIALALGSSDPWRTGPYGHGHFVFSSKISCAPCGHSKPCHQLSHACGDLITPMMVTRLIQQIISKEKIQFSHQQVRLHQTIIGEMGYRLQHVNAHEVSFEIRNLNQILWQKILDQGNVDAALILNSADQKDFEKSQVYLQESLADFQSHFENLIQKLSRNEITMADIKASRNYLSRVSLGNNWNREWLWLFQDLATLSFSSPLHYLSAFQDRLEQLKAAIFYRDEIIKYGKGAPREPGIREIPFNGLAEA